MEIWWYICICTGLRSAVLAASRVGGDIWYHKIPLHITYVCKNFIFWGDLLSFS